MSKKTPSQQQQSATTEAVTVPVKPAAAPSPSAPVPTSYVLRARGTYSTRQGYLTTLEAGHTVHLHVYGAEEIDRMKRAGLQLDPLK